jgi:hypothetical protein
MKRLFGAAMIVLVIGVASAEERIPAEEAEKIAKLITGFASKEADLPFKTDLDTSAPFAMKEGERAAMIIPDKKLTVDTLAKAGKDVVPVGHLWFRKVAPVVGDSAIGNDKLRIVNVTTDDGKEYALPLLLVGVRKGKDAPELVFFGKAKEIVATVPLKAADAKQDTTIEYEVKRGEGMRGTLIFKLLGKYQAELPVEAVD